MKSSKNLIIFLLALTCIGGAALAWHQYQELIGLRATALDANERADLQKKLAALQKANHDLQDQLAAARGQSGDGEDAMAADDQAPAPGQNDRGGNREARRAEFAQRMAAMRDLMAKPEVQAMVAAQQKSVLNARYGALFRSLNLTPDQAGKLTDLLLERQAAQRDVMQAAREQGINPRTDPDGFNKLLADAQNPINDSIKSLLGDSGYNQLSNYDQTMPQRNLVNTLQQRLSYSDAPLTPAQADQLVQILAANAPTGNATTADANGGRRGGMDFGGGPGGRMAFGGGGIGAVNAIANTAPITPSAVNQAQSVLSQSQLTALQQLQQQQAAAQQLQQLVRSTMQSVTGNATTGGTTNAPPPRRGGGG